MRQTQNIFFYLRELMWKRAWYFLKRFDKTTRGDTYNGLIEITRCKVLGHEPNYSSIGNEMWQEQDVFCKHCQKYIRSLEYEEHIQILREIKLKRILKK